MESKSFKLWCNGALCTFTIKPSTVWNLNVTTNVNVTVNVRNGDAIIVCIHIKQMKLSLVISCTTSYIPWGIKQTSQINAYEIVTNKYNWTFYQQYFYGCISIRKSNARWAWYVQSTSFLQKYFVYSDMFIKILFYCDSVHTCIIGCINTKGKAWLLPITYHMKHQCDVHIYFRRRKPYTRFFDLYSYLNLYSLSFFCNRFLCLVWFLRWMMWWWNSFGIFSFTSTEAHYHCHDARIDTKQWKRNPVRWK